jgi:hypothetical protein
MAAVLPSTLHGVQEAASSAQVRPPFIHPDGVWIRAGYGSFDANADPQLPGQRGHHTFMFGVGAELGIAPMVGLDFDVISTTRTYDTEGGAFIIVVDDETSVTSSAFTLGTRLILPPASPVRAYLAAGLAYVHTTFKTDASLFGIPGTAKEQTDGGIRPVLGAGAQVIREPGGTRDLRRHRVARGIRFARAQGGDSGKLRNEVSPRAPADFGTEVGATARASRRGSPL